MTSIRSRALQAGIHPQTVYSRLRRGWSVDIAVSAPVQDPRVSGALGASRSPWAAFGTLTNRPEEKTR